jgi:hypothetical protein
VHILLPIGGMRLSILPIQGVIRKTIRRLCSRPQGQHPQQKQAKAVHENKDCQSVKVQRLKVSATRIYSLHLCQRKTGIYSPSTPSKAL